MKVTTVDAWGESRNGGFCAKPESSSRNLANCFYASWCVLQRLRILTELSAMGGDPPNKLACASSKLRRNLRTNCVSG